MSPEEWRRSEAARWIELAGRDLRVAEMTASEVPSASVFHCQQCAGKIEKALLTFHDVPFRKTHDLRELGKQCAGLEPSLGPLVAEAANLTDYAVVFRYLDAPREPDAAEAEVAIGVARRLFDAIRGLVGEDVTEARFRVFAPE